MPQFSRKNVKPILPSSDPAAYNIEIDGNTPPAVEGMTPMIISNKRIFSAILFGFIASTTLSLYACGSKTAAAVIAASTGGGSSTPTNPTCSTQVVDTGQKGTVAGTIRGAYSDMKMIPSTSSPATAFLDQSNLSIKFNYWNGSGYITEVVSGDASASWIRLAFNSSGKPFIFWASGTALKVAVRSQTIPSGKAATWTAGIVDNSNVAPRAIEVAVNPLDQIIVTYNSDTATTGRTKFAYCDTGCASPTDFNAMATNPYVDNTNVTAAVTANGIGWCKGSSSSYYPMVSYSVTGNIKVGICKNPLAQCLNGSNWTTGVVVAAGNTVSKLYLDPTITGDVPRVATSTGAALNVYKMGTTACTASLGAFSASASLGAYGSQWISFLKDQTNQRFHIVANNGTTSTVYMNSATTDPVGSWNAAATIDSSAVPAATAGGADLDITTLGLYSSYGVNAANYDLKLARVYDYTVSSAAASIAFSRSTPDLSGMMQLSAASSQLKNIAIASSSTGVPGIAYVDFSSGTATTGKLKFAQRTGSGATATWNVYFIPGVTSPQFPSLAYDHTNRPWIGYFDASVNKFYLVTNSATDATGFWTTYEFPSQPSGAPGALPRANNTAVGMYYTSGIANPVLAVLDNNGVSIGLRAATLNYSSRAWSTVSSIDALGANGAAHLSIASSPNYGVFAAYQDLTATQVKYTAMTSINTWSATFGMSGVNRGQGVSAQIDNSGYPSVSYFDSTNNTVYLAKCNSSLTSCATGGWSSQAVESVAGVSGIPAASGQLLSTANLYDSSGYTFIVYPRGAGNDGNLILSDNYSGSFAASVAASGLNAGVSILAPALNFGGIGFDLSATRSSAGVTTIASMGPGNWLYATTCQ